MGALEYILFGVVLFFGPDIINNASVGFTIPLLALVGIKIFGVLLVLVGVCVGIWSLFFPNKKDSDAMRKDVGTAAGSVLGSAIMGAATKGNKVKPGVVLPKQAYNYAGYTTVTRKASEMPIGISYGYARKPKGASKAVKRKVVKKKVTAKAKAHSRSKTPKKEIGILERIIRFIKGAFMR